MGVRDFPHYLVSKRFMGTSPREVDDGTSRCLWEVVNGYVSSGDDGTSRHLWEVGDWSPGVPFRVTSYRTPMCGRPTRTSALTNIYILLKTFLGVFDDYHQRRLLHSTSCFQSLTFLCM